MTIIASALETGYSTAVHGIITVIDRKHHNHQQHHHQHRNQHCHHLKKKQVLHYKALDTGVLCNLVGSSS